MVDGPRTESVGMSDQGVGRRVGGHCEGGAGLPGREHDGLGGDIERLSDMSVHQMPGRGGAGACTHQMDRALFRLRQIPRSGLRLL